MAKSHSRKGKRRGTPPPSAPGLNASTADDGADRTVVLPPADADPTLNLPASAPADEIASAPAADVPASGPTRDEPGVVAADPAAPATDGAARAESTDAAKPEGTAVVKAEAAKSEPAKTERKTGLVGSLRSKDQLRAREKARGKGGDKKAAAGAAATTAADGVLEWFKSIGAAILLFFVIRTFIITAYSIPSESMEDTLLVGDYLMANNALFGATIPFTNVKLPALRDPRRGEIVVFRPTYNEPQIDVVKRVVGTPGDTLQMADGVLFRNGQRVNEPYAHYDQGYDENIDMEGFGLMDPTIRPDAYGAKNHLPLLLPTVDGRRYRPTRNNWGPVMVPAGHYWLMGDNRDQSLDSRFMGPIPREVIRGKPLFIYYSYDKRNAEAAFPRFVTAARWRRIGDGIR